MAALPLPRSSDQLDSLPPVASAVAIPTTVAPTVGQGASSLRSAARPYSPIVRPFATGRMIATGSILHIQPSSYRPATAPITHAVMLPIGTINLYVGFTGSSDPADPLPRSVPLDGPYAYDDGIFNHVEPTAVNTEPFPSSGEEHARSSDLEDDANSAVPP